MASQTQVAIDIAECVTFKIFLQAVIDDDVEMVKKCLDAEPELLLIEPDKNFMIESNLTWQRFYAENALMMAVKRKQIKMVELLLSYYDKLEQTKDVIKQKRDALLSWSPYKMQINTKGENEIAIPQEYLIYAQSLADIFAEEIPTHGGKRYSFINNFNEKTELACSSLFNILLPKSGAIHLDDYLDPELFLLALSKACWNNKPSGFRNDARVAFCIRAIGLVQSVLPPETAKIFCENSYRVLYPKKTLCYFEIPREISARAQSLKLRPNKIYKSKEEKSFYRSSRESRSGLGFDFYCGDRGWCLPDKYDTGCDRDLKLSLEKLLETKEAIFLKLALDHTTEDYERSCVIL
jgi:hypothetical protein